MATSGFVSLGSIVTLAAACGGAGTASIDGAAVSGADQAPESEEERHRPRASADSNGDSAAGTGAGVSGAGQAEGSNDPTQEPGATTDPDGDSPAGSDTPPTTGTGGTAPATEEPTNAGSDEPSSEPDTTADETAEPATDGGPLPVEAVPAVVGWKANILPLFETSCGSAVTGCHAKEVFAGQSGSNCRGWLSLADEPLGATYWGEYRTGESTGCPDLALHDRLLTESWQCNGLPYITPGDPENSYVYRKIAGGPYCDDGDVPSAPMPQTGSLTAEQIDMLRRWIEAGATTDG